MSETSTVNEIRKLRVNAVYSKKTHFNAASRKKKYHHRLTLPTVIINVITGTTLFALMSKEMNDKIWIPAILAFISAILSGVSEYFKFGKSSEQHEQVATRFLQIIRKCDASIAKFKDDLIDLKILSTQYDELAIELDEINASAAPLQPSDSDYQKSRLGVNDGEETYTEAELRPGE